MKTNWVSPSSIASDWKEDSGLTDMAGSSAASIKKWANDRIKEHLTSDQLIECIALINVEDSVGKLPYNHRSTIQAAYGFADINKDCRREEVVKWAATHERSGCTVTVNVDCPRCGERDCNCDEPVARFAINAFDLSANPQWTERYKQQFFRSQKIGAGVELCGYNPNFYLMRPTTNNFFNAKHHIEGCINLRSDSAVEYNIVPPHIEVNVKKCKVLLAYMGYNVNKEGWLMCPDLPEVWEGIKHYIDAKFAYKQWTKSRKPEDERFYRSLLKLSDDKMFVARLKLGLPEANRIRAILNNLQGRMVPNYYSEENFLAASNDSYEPYE